MNSSSHHYIHWFQRDIAASSATNWWVIDIQRYSSKNLHGKWKSSEPKLHEFGFQQVAFECVKLSFWETRPKDPDTRSPWLDRGWWDIPDYTGPGHMIYRYIYIYRAFEDARSAAASREQKQPKQRRIQSPAATAACWAAVPHPGQILRQVIRPKQGSVTAHLDSIIWRQDRIRQIYTSFWGFCHFLKYWRMSSCFRCWKILLDRKLPCFVWWFTSW